MDMSSTLHDSTTETFICALTRMYNIYELFISTSFFPKVSFGGTPNEARSCYSEADM